MKTEKKKVKKTVIIFWSLSISLFLWYFSILINSEIDFFQFINFCILLFGSGLAYHVVSELAICPVNQDNLQLWHHTKKSLAVVFVGYIIAGLSLLLGKFLGNGLGWLMAFWGLISGMFWAMHFLLKLESPIRKLLASKKSLKINLEVGTKKGTRG